VTCYGPLEGWYARERNPSGKRSLVFNVQNAMTDMPVQIPCGRCIGCRVERARQWAVRAMHEAKVSDGSVFVTLTYDDKHLPLHGSLCRRDVQLFLKRLRKAYGAGVRFFGCGEYGGHTLRPHYHILLFNVDFPDKRRVVVGLGGADKAPLYESKALGRLWQVGYHSIGDVTFDSARYVAGYCLKKINGPKADSAYDRILDTGEVVRVAPEFGMMSLKPGIGERFFNKFHIETYDHDSCIVDGKEVRPPRFYDLKYQVIEPKKILRVKRVRRAKALTPESQADNTQRRLRVREELVKRNLARNRREEI